jgi:chromosome segregation ATPase
MTDLLFAGARTALAAAGEAIDRLQERYSAAKAATDKANAEQGERAAEIDAHKKRLAELTMRQTAEMEARRQEIANRENVVGAREREVEEKARRAEARMRDAENRAADLSNRLHGHAA